MEFILFLQAQVFLTFFPKLHNLCADFEHQDLECKQVHFAIKVFLKGLSFYFFRFNLAGVLSARKPPLTNTFTKHKWSHSIGVFINYTGVGLLMGLTKWELR